MSNYEITKLQKIKEVCNDMVHNFYYIAYFRLYSNDKKHYKKGKFIVWFDAFDVQEYFEKDFFTKEDVKQYASEIACNDLESFYKSYEDTTSLLHFCNDTIEDFNSICWY